MTQAQAVLAAAKKYIDQKYKEVGVYNRGYIG